MQAEKAGCQSIEILLLHRQRPHISHLRLHTVDSFRCDLRFIAHGAKCASERRIPAVDSGVGEREALIQFQQNVIFCLRDLAANLDAELRYIHMDCIAQAYSLRFRDVRITGELPELSKIDLNVDVRLSQTGILQIALDVVA